MWSMRSTNQSAILATRAGKTRVFSPDLEAAVEKVIGGYERKAVGFEESRRRVAYHESGHAVAGWFLEHGDPLVKVHSSAYDKAPL